MQQLSRVLGQRIKVGEGGGVAEKRGEKREDTNNKKDMQADAQELLWTWKSKRERWGGGSVKTALWGYNLHTTMLIIYSTHLLHK